MDTSGIEIPSTLVPHVPKEIKAQIEFVQNPEGRITINVLDPLLFMEWKECTMLDLMDHGNKQSDIMRLMIATLTGATYWEGVDKVVDVRTGKVVDVSKRNWKTSLHKEFNDSYIRERYDDRVRKGVIDKDEFPFEEFAKDFRENNK